MEVFTLREYLERLDVTSSDVLGVLHSWGLTCVKADYLQDTIIFYIKK